ncbi:MAG: hypothetical protein ACYTAN_14365, partial [Planctomycetota bacterium]
MSSAQPAAAPAKTIADIKPPFTFTAHVMTPEGAPVGGVAIQCRYPSRGETIFDQTKETAQDGTATFTVVGEVDLARHRTFWLWLADDAFVGNSGSGVSPVDGEFDVYFTVLPAAPVSVRVFDEDGRFVPGARVRISGLMDTYRAGSPDDPDRTRDARSRRVPVSAQGGTDENGVARLRFPDMQADVLVIASGFAPGVEKGLVSLPRDKPLDVTIGRGVTLAGRVVDETGAAVSSVSLFCKRLVSIGSVGDFDERSSRSGEDGSFAFDDLAPGTYEVGALPDGLGPSVCIQTARVSVTETSEPVTLVS